MILLNEITTNKESKDDNLGMAVPYIPASESCYTLNVDTPDSMGFEIHSALKKIKNEVGGDLNEYLIKKLKYANNDSLCKSLASEQIDGVSTAIYNIESRNQGIIIGDQTGIGKGRQAAAIIRYAKENNILAIFISEKVNLFSDMYRDLKDIDSEHYRAFIVNEKTPTQKRTTIRNKEGVVIYKSENKKVIDSVIDSKKVPAKYDFVCATYTQFSALKTNPKKEFLLAISQGAIIVMDESHNASGKSNTGRFLKQCVENSKGTIFLSATFAKTPANMPIYAAKTSMQDANLSDDDLVFAITNGGVALQEILAAQLVQEGQMIRRERTFEGIEVKYMVLENKAKEHSAIADNVTNIIRLMIAFQTVHVNPIIKALDKQIADENKTAELRKGTIKAGVANSPYFSRVFNIINQLLFSIKANDVADLAILRLKEGLKPVIAFSSTMGSIVDGIPDDAVIDADFKEVLRRGLKSCMQYTITEANGDKKKKTLKKSAFTGLSKSVYESIQSKIEEVSTGIVISPIDLIVQKINDAGYTTAEVTGRKKQINLSFNSNGTITGVIATRIKLETDVAFRMFNDNEVDVLLINQSGSTGASAHAVPTLKVPADQVKQRVMIVLQAELDINTEIQKRGRINRTGQIIKPIYNYISSAIPAEKRLAMMLQKKMKSLDANTTSNQKNSEDLLKSEDFLNKYGDNVVRTFLSENPELYYQLGSVNIDTTDIAHKVSGRVAILPIVEQTRFYTQVLEQYRSDIQILLDNGDYDLEVQNVDLQAEVISKEVVVIGRNNNSLFGGNTYLEKCIVNNLKKPFSKSQVIDILQQNDYLNAKENNQKMVDEYDIYVEKELTDYKNKKTLQANDAIKDIPNEKGYLEALDEENYISKRTIVINEKSLDSVVRYTTKFKSQTSVTRGYIKFFKVGVPIKYPEVSTASLIDGVVLDAKFNKKADNPYTPSNISFSIALANSTKRMELKASSLSQEALNGIIAQTYRLGSYRADEILRNWDNTIKESTSDRIKQYIVTGNILQGYSTFEYGKLVSYTTNDEKIVKGILLPFSFQPKDSENGAGQYVTVPINLAISYFMSSTRGAYINTNTAITFQRRENEFKIFVPSSKKKGGFIFLDEDILKLTKSNNFEKSGSDMIETILDEKMPALLNLLSEKHSVSALIPISRANDIPAIQNAIKAADKAQNETGIDEKNAREKRKRKLNLLKLKLQLLEI